MNQYCQAWESPRKVVAEFTSWINKAPNNTPRNETRPPNRLAPPSTTAAPLPSVYSTPWFGSPIPSCDITIKPPSTVNRDEARKAPTITQEVRMPILAADASLEPTARILKPHRV